MNCIVLPVYKPFSSLDHLEKISLIQLYRKLRRHPIYIIAPAGLEIKPYLDHACGFGIDLRHTSFSDEYFAGLDGYNRLLQSPRFYQSFAEYEYMLIYQTDAFVFSDDLDSWCEKGYDFIGAPLFEGYDKADENSRIIGVGNGGFSLRRIPSCLRVLEKLAELTTMGWAYESAVKKPEHAGFHLDEVVLMPGVLQEDIFWSQYAPLIEEDYSVAPVEEATRFSFEVQPATLLKINDGKLPFGCHAWWRYDLAFWKPYIESQGHKIGTRRTPSQAFRSSLNRLVSMTGYNLYKKGFTPARQESPDTLLSGLQRLREQGVSPQLIIAIYTGRDTGKDKALAVWPDAAYTSAGLRHMRESSLDEFTREKEGSILLKLDGYGYEAAIIKRAQATLSRVGALIIGVYGFRIHPDSLLFHELSAYLDDQGFRLFDIANIQRRPGDEAFWQATAIYLRKSDPVFQRNSYD